MEWLEGKEEFVKKFIKLSNNYVSIYSKAVDYGSGEKISLSEVQVLEIVIEQKEIRISDLATSLGYTKAAISKSVSKLEKKQLVLKYKKASNQKEKFIKVTKYGLEVYDKYQKYIYANLFKEIFELVDSVDENFISTYNDFIDIINKFYDTFHKKID